jgi:hypothetical protein
LLRDQVLLVDLFQAINPQALLPRTYKQTLEVSQGGIMAIKVFIKLHIREGHVEPAVALLEEFRNMAIRESGHISGETLGVGGQ